MTTPYRNNKRDNDKHCLGPPKWNLRFLVRTDSRDAEKNCQFPFLFFFCNPHYISLAFDVIIL